MLFSFDGVPGYAVVVGDFVVVKVEFFAYHDGIGSVIVEAIVFGVGIAEPVVVSGKVVDFDEVIIIYIFLQIKLKMTLKLIHTQHLIINFPKHWFL